MNKLSYIIYLLKNHWDDMIIIATFLFFAVAISASLYDCNKKSGIYVHYTCLKAEVIK